jgi:hypothetical protein
MEKTDVVLNAKLTSHFHLAETKSVWSYTSALPCEQTSATTSPFPLPEPTYELEVSAVHSVSGLYDSYTLCSKVTQVKLSPCLIN